MISITFGTRGTASAFTLETVFRTSFLRFLKLWGWLLGWMLRGGLGWSLHMSEMEVSDCRPGERREY